MKFEKVRSHFQITGPIYERTIVFVFSMLVFFLAISAVFYGFIGYYSRVALISEFQKEDKDANIDYIFLQIDQIERDEADLNRRRSTIAGLEQKMARERAQIKSIAFASKEYEEYVTSAMAVIDLFYAARELLTDDYWKELNRIDYSQPDLSQAELFSNPVYGVNVAADQRAELYRKIGSAIQNFRYKIVYYNTKHGSLISQAGNAEKTEIDGSQAVIRQVLTRNPQLGSRDEIALYRLQDLVISPSQEQSLGKHRAVVGSYRRALGSASVILQWPTIVSTMVVTLATGLLGGIISFMGSTARSKAPGASDRTDIRDEIIAFVRRSIFGVVAALGIFLLAGAGLLVLSAQSGKLVSLGSIELSPYFVAFLAFISGFLADDAFAKITKTGQSILQTADKERAARGGKKRTASAGDKRD